MKFFLNDIKTIKNNKKKIYIFILTTIHRTIKKNFGILILILKIIIYHIKND